MTNDPLHVLIIEDVAPFTILLNRLLAPANIILDTAACLAEGIQKAQQGNYQAVLLDLGLPDSAGLKTLSSFQSCFTDIPIIIFTSLDDENLAIEAVKHGAQDYLIKGAYLAQGAAGQRLLIRSIYSAIERFSIQTALVRERALMESRVIERTAKLAEVNEHLRSLTARLVSAQEDERRRISLELHDETGQFITALRLSLALIESELPPEYPDLQSKVNAAIGLADAAMERLRILAHDLHPPALLTVGLDQTLRDYCERVARQAKLPVEYRGAELDDLPSHFQISIYRIVQEALTNVVKHSRAQRAKVTINRDAEMISIEVQDDGQGFELADGETKSVHHGLGLIGIQERVEAIGGVMQIFTEPGFGTRIFVTVPLQEER